MGTNTEFTSSNLTDATMEAEYSRISDEVITMSDQERLEKADSIKKIGNEAFVANDNILANFHYSRSLLYCPKDSAASRAILLSNRSAARLKLEEYRLAAEDAMEATNADPSYVKAYFRLGAAHTALSKFDSAIIDFRAVLRRKPGDREAKKKLELARKCFIEQQFALAIETPNPLATCIESEFTETAVQSGYTGPKLDLDKSVAEGRYTVEFVNELADWFKANVENSASFPLPYIYNILRDVIQLLKPLPSLVDIPVPEGTRFTVCGDTHGQFYDVFTIFKKNGPPSETNPYLFNGDFVDRGSFSYELIVMFFLYKLVYPNHFHMTRGNHESTSMNTMYGFKGEVLHKANERTFDLFTEAFNMLPIACCVGTKVLVLHGGLFEEHDVTLDDIRNVDRFRQPPESGLMCDALWSDPTFSRGRTPGHRGCGVLFGPDVTADFCTRNGLKYIVRSHEMKPNGYSVDHNGKCITVFSAPNYCDTMGNKGAYLVFDDKLDYRAEIFYHVPHPNVPAMKFANPLLRG